MHKTEGGFPALSTTSDSVREWLHCRRRCHRIASLGCRVAPPWPYRMACLRGWQGQNISVVAEIVCPARTTRRRLQSPSSKRLDARPTWQCAGVPWVSRTMWPNTDTKLTEYGEQRRKTDISRQNFMQLTDRCDSGRSDQTMNEHEDTWRCQWRTQLRYLTDSTQATDNSRFIQHSICNTHKLPDNIWQALYLLISLKSAKISFDILAHSYRHHNHFPP